MRKTLALSVGVAALAAGAAACTIGEPLDEPSTEPVQIVTVTETAADGGGAAQSPSPSMSLSDDPTAALTEAVDNVIAAYGGRAALAVSGDQEYSAGDTTGFASWSTMKVPVAIAALNSHPEMTVEAANAIQASDNGAADMLWNATTPEAVEAVLAEGHSPVAVERNVTRPGFSAFGQTQWTVDEQARFASHLSCVAGAGPVLEHMDNLTAGGNYGLGTLPGARLKGGWGPSISGAYEVRQLGLVPDANGRQIAVAIAASAADGTYESGQAMLTQLAADLTGVLDTAPAAVCQ